MHVERVSVPKLQSILQQIHMRRLGDIGAQLDDRKKERVQILTLCPQALWEHTNTESQCQIMKTWQRMQTGGVKDCTLCALA